MGGTFQKHMIIYALSLLTSGCTTDAFGARGVVKGREPILYNNQRYNMYTIEFGDIPGDDGADGADIGNLALGVKQVLEEERQDLSRVRSVNQLSNRTKSVLSTWGFKEGTYLLTDVIQFLEYAIFNVNKVYEDWIRNGNKLQFQVVQKEFFNVGRGITLFANSPQLQNSPGADLFFYPLMQMFIAYGEGLKPNGCLHGW